MIGETELGMMRQGAVLVNSSRGLVVDNEAWAEWLANGKGKAVVDVWEGEPEINRRLLSLSSVATPISRDIHSRGNNAPPNGSRSA